MLTTKEKGFLSSEPVKMATHCFLLFYRVEIWVALTFTPFLGVISITYVARVKEGKFTETNFSNCFTDEQKPKKTNMKKCSGKAYLYHP